MRGRLKNTYLSFAVLSLVLLLIGLIASCGSSGNEPQLKGELNACTLLAGIDPETLLGEPVGEPKESIHQKDAHSSVSRCGYSAKNNWKKTFSLQVRYVPDSTNPKSIPVPLESQDIGDLKLESKAIRGLGDAAVSLSGAGSMQLRVYWNNHYRMIVVITGLGDHARTLEKATSVARHVINKL